jgi:hypothetical protein
VRSLEERVQAATKELQGLERIIVSGDFSPRILSEFRSAVDNIRHTARAVQAWIGLQQQNRDPYSVMTTLSGDRVRRATQIARDLTLTYRRWKAISTLPDWKSFFRQSTP